MDERAAADKFIDGEWKALTWNPLNGGWEYLSRREWRLLKLGIPKANHFDDEWRLVMLEGPEFAVRYAFGLDLEKHEATIKWLALEYKKFNIKTAPQLYSWSQFMMSVYPIDKYHHILKAALEDEIKKQEIKRLRECFLMSLQEESESFAVRSRKRRQKT